MERPSLSSSGYSSDDGEKQDAQRKDQDQYPPGYKMVLIVMALVLSNTLLSLDMTIVATAIPKITDEFKGLDKVGWYSSAFFTFSAAFQSSWGKIYKYFPLKTTFLVAILIFELGSAVCGAARNSETLIAGRAVAGLGSSGLVVGCYTIIGFSAPPRRRPALTGVLGASYGLASAVGPILGGVLTEKVSWRWCFYINLPVGAVSALVILLFFQAPGQTTETASVGEKIRQMDPAGIVLVIGATICYTLAVQYGGVSHAWNSPVVIGLLVGFGVLTVGWYGLHRYQGERSMVPPRLVGDRRNLSMFVYTFFFSGGYYTAIYFLPVYFQSAHDSSPTISGVENLPFIITVSVATTLAGALVAVTGRYKMLLVVGGAAGAVGAGLLTTMDQYTPAGNWIAYQIVAGVGWGVACQIPLIAVQGNVANKDLASATGMLLFSQGIGSSFIVSGAQAAFVNQMIVKVEHVAPSVDKTALVQMGATEIRKIYTDPKLQSTLIGCYVTGIKVAFYFCIICAALATVIAIVSKGQKLGEDKEDKEDGKKRIPSE
ncbi:Major facilitator superfamily domain, general substrate transporter [Ophiocordyceps camponoti-floridani]|uniref:Major facilitator superfamily domain, general substrate transporter n=1 Tax=Ophiocordyceps camponoti-floridani TaxID=2030778 RepID=A0A8H4VBC3_9HYPO|nr:Major facilitator superfamily domain, general substrate transporter [Ophiocordyceps camponoti-floridani]